MYIDTISVTFRLVPSGTVFTTFFNILFFFFFTSTRYIYCKFLQEIISSLNYINQSIQVVVPLGLYMTLNFKNCIPFFISLLVLLKQINGVLEYE